MVSRRRFLFVIEYCEGSGIGESGGVQRSVHILKALQGVGICDVVLIRVPKNEKDGMFVSELRIILQPESKLFLFYKNPKKASIIYRGFRSVARLLGLYNGIYTFFPSVKDSYPDVIHVADKREYAAIVVRYFRVGVCTGLFKFSSVPILLDVDDNPLEMIETSAKLWVNKIRLTQIWLFLTKIWMKKNLRQCEFAWWVRKEELNQFSQCRGRVLQNIPVFPDKYTNYKQLLRGQSRLNVLFVGRLKYKPNREGLALFLREIWPKVLQEVSAATLNIVGGGADRELLNLMSSTTGVRYYGIQRDLYEFYSKANISICPIYQGAGSKIKILESMAYERPVVVTPHAFEGLKEDLDNGTGLLIAHTIDEFASIIIKLWDHPKFALEVAQKGFVSVNNFFSQNQFTQIVQEGVHNILCSGDHIFY